MKAAGQSMVLGVQVLEMGVFAGILTGALSGYLYNKYSGVQFNGRWRFIPATVLSPLSCCLSPCCSAWS
jgi:phosphotransferase system  glucose/maltose/N-acetylglucosamine-specific IIC component